MPTYGYRCTACGHEYEKFQKITDDTRTKCPQCGKRGERLISGGAGLVFKGSGFYITDYKRAGEKKTGKKEKKKDKGAPKSEGGGGGDSKTGGEKS